MTWWWGSLAHLDIQVVWGLWALKHMNERVVGTVLSAKVG